MIIYLFPKPSPSQADSRREAGYPKPTEVAYLESPAVSITIELRSWSISLSMEAIGKDLLFTSSTHSPNTRYAANSGMPHRMRFLPMHVRQESDHER